MGIVPGTEVDAIFGTEEEVVLGIEVEANLGALLKDADLNSMCIPAW